MMPRIAEARLKFCKIPGLWGQAYTCVELSAERILYFSLDSNDSASLLVLEVMYTLDIRRA